MSASDFTGQKSVQPTQREIWTLVHEFALWEYGLPAAIFPVKFPTEPELMLVLCPSREHARKIAEDTGDVQAKPLQINERILIALIADLSHAGTTHVAQFVPGPQGEIGTCKITEIEKLIEAVQKVTLSALEQNHHPKTKTEHHEKCEI